jgi:hypothetical protein
MRIIQGYLELQCDRVDAVLTMFRNPGRVIGGVAGPDVIRLFVQGGPYVRFREIAACQDVLAEALGAPELQVQPAPGQAPGTAVLTFKTPAQLTAAKTTRPALPVKGVDYAGQIELSGL